MKLNRAKVDLLLAENEMTIMQLAEAYGASGQRLRAILNSVNIAPRTAGKLSKALNARVEDIIIQEEG